MQKAAARGAASLGVAARATARFVRSRISIDGGFVGRDEESDLYYTLFGVESLIALGEPMAYGSFEKILSRYLLPFGAGTSLDLVHLCSLARCWSDLPGAQQHWLTYSMRHTMVETLRSYRSVDGGFAPVPHAKIGTAYAAFLASGALEDLKEAIPQPEALADALESLRCDDGGFTNESLLGVPITSATAAAITLLLHLHRPPHPETIDWLLDRRNDDGGFAASTALPVSDLLSTATALHALGQAGVVLDPQPRLACRKYVESLRTEEGGYRGSAADGMADGEYTFYALLALGYLGSDHGR
jgi:hypothetical protein